MATVQSAIALQDLMTPVLRSVESALRSTASAAASVNSAVGRAFADAKQHIDTAGLAAYRFADNMGKSEVPLKMVRSGLRNMKDAVKDLPDMMKKAADALKPLGNELKDAGKHAKKAFDFSDGYMDTIGRLGLVNDGMQTTAQLQDMIAAAALRSRASYQGTADTVYKMGVMAKGAFGSNEEVIAFSEMMNKQLAISHTSTAGKDTVLSQLTQSMGSGSLKVDAFDSILGQAPTIIQTIADYMGMPIAQIRKMAEEGQISAAMVKDAMLSSTDEINRQFEATPQTFAGAMNNMVTMAIQAFGPVAEQINAFANSEGFAQGMSLMGSLLVGLAEVAGFVVDMIASSLSYLAQNPMAIVFAALGLVALALWALIPPVLANPAIWIILAIVGAALALGYVLGRLGVTMEQVMGFLGGLFAFIYNLFVDVFNVVAAVAEFFYNAWIDPIGSVQRLFYDLLESVLGVIYTIVNAIDGIFKTDFSAAVKGWQDQMYQWGETNLPEARIKMQTLGKMDVGETATKSSMLLENMFSGMPSDLLSGQSGPGISYDTIDPSGDLLKTLGMNESDGPLNIQGTSGGRAVGVSGEVDLSDEDIKYIMDGIERRYINMINLQSPAPVINVQFGDIRETADVGAISDALIAETRKSLSMITALAGVEI